MKVKKRKKTNQIKQMIQRLNQKQKLTLINQKVSLKNCLIKKIKIRKMITRKKKNKKYKIPRTQPVQSKNQLKRIHQNKARILRLVR